MALPFTLKEVADLLDLEQVAHRKTAGGYYTTCPFCHSDLLHLKFDNKAGGGVFRCVNCGNAGNAAELYAAFKNIDKRRAYAEICHELDLNNESTKIRAAALPKVEFHEKKPIAPVEKISAFYTAYLKRLNLSKEHRNNLIIRGLTDAQIDKFEFKSTPSNLSEMELAILTLQVINETGFEPVDIPGFFKKTIKNTEYWIPYVSKETGFYVPVRNSDGLMYGMQIRMDTKDKNKYKAFSSNPDYDLFRNGGTASCQFVHFSCSINRLNAEWLKKLKHTLYLTEGPLKAQIASLLSNKVFLAIQGVCSTTYLEQALLEAKKIGFTRVVTCLDMDKLDNPQVAQALEKITAKIQSVGLEVVDFNWDSNYKGIDDYLLAKKG